jgi:protein tyrosine phosphatase
MDITEISNKNITEINFDEKNLEQFFNNFSGEKGGTFYNSYINGKQKKKYLRHGNIGIGPIESTAVSNTTTNLKFNANYINLLSDNPVNDYQYIAAGCAPTISVMNSLILQTNIKHVVMVTRIQEGTKQKCLNYFSSESISNSGYTFNGIEQVTREIKESTENIEISNIKLKVDNGEEHEYTHYWFKAWPDHGVPDEKTFIDFLKIVNNNAGDEPLLVHCSAGVGRTGTFIILDHILNKAGLNSVSTIGDIKELIELLRSQRNNFMVQTASQFIFILKVLQNLKKTETTNSTTIATPPPRPTAVKPMNTTAPPRPTAVKPMNTTAPPRPTAVKPMNTTAPPTAVKPMNTTAPPRPTAAKPMNTTAPIVKPPEPIHQNPSSNPVFKISSNNKTFINPLHKTQNIDYKQEITNLFDPLIQIYKDNYRDHIKDNIYKSLKIPITKQDEYTYKILSHYVLNRKQAETQIKTYINRNNDINNDNADGIYLFRKAGETTRGKNSSYVVVLTVYMGNNKFKHYPVKVDKQNKYSLRNRTETFDNLEKLEEHYRKNPFKTFNKGLFQKDYKLNTITDYEVPSNSSQAGGNKRRTKKALKTSKNKTKRKKMSSRKSKQVLRKTKKSKQVLRKTKKSKQVLRKTKKSKQVLRKNKK